MASKDLNVVSIVGRLTRNSEFRVANNGTPVSNFSIAVNRRRKNGELWEDETNFFDVVFMGKGAERINMYLEKGRQVAIQGELHQRRWESEQGPRQSVEIWAQEIQLLAQSSQSQTAPSGGYQQNYGGGFNTYGQATSYQQSGMRAPSQDAFSQGAPSQVQGMPMGSQGQAMPQANKPQVFDKPQTTSGPESFEDDDFPF